MQEEPLSLDDCEQIPNRIKTKWGIVAGVVGLLGFLLILIVVVFNLEGVGSSRKGNSSRPDPASTIQVNAFALWLDYKENEASANMKYKGQWLEVSGAVLDVVEVRDGYEVRYIASNSNLIFPGTVAHFSRSAQSSLNDIHRQMSVQVLGRCLGRKSSDVGLFDFIVYLDSCQRH